MSSTKNSYLCYAPYDTGFCDADYQPPGVLSASSGLRSASKNPVSFGHEDGHNFM